MGFSVCRSYQQVVDITNWLECCHPMCKRMNGKQTNRKTDERTSKRTNVSQQTWRGHDEPHEVRNELFYTDDECAIHEGMITLPNVSNKHWWWSDPEREKQINGGERSQWHGAIPLTLPLLLPVSAQCRKRGKSDLAFFLLLFFLSFRLVFKIELLEPDNGRLTSKKRERGRKRKKQSKKWTRNLYLST